jgi:hypothetical protein
MNTIFVFKEIIMHKNIITCGISNCSHNKIKHINVKMNVILICCLFI